MCNIFRVINQHFCFKLRLSENLFEPGLGGNQKSPNGIDAICCGSKSVHEQVKNKPIIAYQLGEKNAVELKIAK